MLDGGVRHNLEAPPSTAYTTTLGSARAGLGRDGNHHMPAHVQLDQLLTVQARIRPCTNPTESHESVVYVHGVVVHSLSPSPMNTESHR